MTRKFEIVKLTQSSSVVLLSTNGQIETQGDRGASIEYEFDSDGDVHINIDGQYFSKDDLEELRNLIDAFIKYQGGK